MIKTDYINLHTLTRAGKVFQFTNKSVLDFVLGLNFRQDGCYPVKVFMKCWMEEEVCEQV